MNTTSVVTSCATTSCSFNQDGCTAMAISVGGAEAKGACLTFAALDARAAVSSPAGQVATCQRLECTHNKDLLCTAGKVSITGDTAQCATYQVA